MPVASSHACMMYQSERPGAVQRPIAITNPKRHMRKPKGDQFTERLQNKAKAKQALIEKLKARPAADDPAVLKRQAERKAIAEAREARAAKRAEEKAKQEAERLAREEAERLEEERRIAEEAVAAAKLLAEQKAARDARYAARKARRK